MNESCMDWNEKVLEMLKSNPPDIAFSTTNVPDVDTVPQGYLHQ
ncbi:hypothetical protein [Bacillus sp. NTK074B]